MKTIRIYCTVCKQDVAAQECYGRHIYLRRPDLDDKRFYMCPTCGNYVGTQMVARWALFPVRSCETKENGFIT